MTASAISLRASLVAAAVVLSMGAGCKPGAEDLCERYAKAQCRFQYGCCNASERQSVGALYGAYHHNEETCVEELTRVYCASLAVYADAERAGRATWSYETSNECLQTVESAASSCDAEVMLTSGPATEGCTVTELATGAVADGDTCYQSFECANEEAACVENEPDDEDETLVSEKGTCTAPPGVGDECPDFLCTQSAWCDASVDPPVCKAKKPDGSECQTALECANAVCDYTGGTGECAAKKANGVECNNHVECESGFCDDTVPACAAKRGDGEACDEDEACESDDCGPNDECVPADEEQVSYDICLADEQ